MNYLSVSQVSGHVFELARTDARHLAGESFGPAPASTSQSFGSLLLDSINNVNASQLTSEALSVQAVVDPESVNAHDVTIAAAKASMSLSIAKNVVDRVIQAYREIQSVR